MKPRLTWDGLGVGVSIWVVEVANEFGGWIPSYYRNSLYDANRCLKAILRNMPERDRELMTNHFRVAEYRRVER